MRWRNGGAVFAGAWLALTALGCGFTSQDIAEVALVNACHALAQQTCAKFRACSPSAFAHAYYDEASCVTLQSEDCDRRRLARGNGANAADVNACAAVVAAESCEGYAASTVEAAPHIDPACSFRGTLAEGAQCIDSGQCASGSCSFYGIDACGTCVERENGPCVADSDCQAGSICYVEVCTPAGKLGDACDFSRPCAGFLTCKDAVCAARPTLGEACHSDCTGDLVCNGVSRVCESPRVAPRGASCAADATTDVHFVCAAGSHCNGTGIGATCVATSSAGGYCRESSDCGPGLGCYESKCDTLDADACVETQGRGSTQYPAFMPSVPEVQASSAPVLIDRPKLALITFDDDGGAGELARFVAALAGSDYWRATTSEYGIGDVSALPPISAPSFAATGARSELTLVSDASIQSFLAGKLASDPGFPPNDGETLYLLAFPAWISLSAGSKTSCDDFHGYHSYFSGPDGSLVPYGVVVDCGDQSRESEISHEAVEAVTDPLYNRSAQLGFAELDADHFAWFLPLGESELTDLCVMEPLAFSFDAELAAEVQRSWSNRAMTAFHHPCVPTPPGSVYFNAVPRTSDTVHFQIGAVALTTRGISIPLGKSVSVPVSLLSDAPLDGPFRVSAYTLEQWYALQWFGSADTTQSDPTLRFSFDARSGLNGDTLNLTISALRQDPNYAAEPFVLVSRRGHDTNVWFSIVGQP